MDTVSSPTRSLPAIKPMLARLTRHPFDSPNHIFELKWDGIRALAFIEGGRVRLQGRNLKDITPSFPELARLARSVRSDQTVLDGELVCFDRNGRPSFPRMQERLRRQARGSADRGPRAHFVAFDLLYAEGVSVMDEPLSERKNLLHKALEPTDAAQACEFVEGGWEGLLRRHWGARARRDNGEGQGQPLPARQA